MKEQTDFDFADYLNLLDTAKSDKGIIEADKLRSHTADTNTMVKHYRIYKTVKLLIERYEVEFPK